MKYFTNTLFLLLATCFATAIHAQCTMVCNNLVQVSLDGNGEATILSDFILEGDYTGCGPIFMNLLDNQGNVIEGPLDMIEVDCEDLGTIIVEVFESTTGNSCWTNIEISDMLNACSFGGNAIVVQDGVCTGYDLVLNGTDPTTPYNDCVDLLNNMQAGTNSLSFTNVEPSAGINGVTTLDLVFMQIGIQNGFLSPVQAVLTDIDENGTVSTSDLIRTRMFILGILDPDELSAFKVFRTDINFIGFDPYDFVNDYHQLSFEDTEFNLVNNLFVNVYKLADLNGSASGFDSEEIEVDTRSFQEIEYQDQYIIKGNEYTVDFSLSNQQEMIGFTTGLQMENANIDAILTTDADLMSNVHNGEALISYLTTDGKNDIKFSIQFTALENGYLSDQLTISNTLSNDLVTADQTASNLRLKGNQIEDISDILLSPNPSFSDANLDFPSSQNGMQKEIAVYNIEGKLIHKYNTLESSIQISRSDLNGAGMYFIRANVAEETKLLKMIFN